MTPATREWLIAHNGERLPPSVLADIAWTGTVIDAEQPWIGNSGSAGFFLSDPAVDWIEAVANGESP